MAIMLTFFNILVNVFALADCKQNMSGTPFLASSWAGDAAEDGG
jgi:hypothetical protein